MATRMLQRRGTAAEWAAANPILGDGELGFVRDTLEIKLGDGVTAWNDLGHGHVNKRGDTMTGRLLVETPDPSGDVAYGSAQLEVRNLDGAPARLALGSWGVGAAQIGCAVDDELRTYNSDGTGYAALLAGPLYDSGYRTYSQANPDTTRVAKTGDTMVGALTLQQTELLVVSTDGSRIRLTSVDNGQYFQVDDVLYITAPWSATLKPLRAAEIYDNDARVYSPGNPPPASISPTIVDAKGDLIVGTANDTETRLPVGTNGQILQADSSQAEGIKWANEPARRWTRSFMMMGA